MKNRFVAIFYAAMLVPVVNSMADDWPMWRHDAGRSGVTFSELPESLKLSWTRVLPAITPAFHSSRLQFDAGYEPVVAGGLLLIASSKSDSVTAYETSTGRQRWVYRTDGPIRFAPAVWNESVCFGSDDGHLYCVELRTGALRWKFRAVPSERRLLGNRRLISVWPVRGGPVVAAGRVHFAAGVWPFEGVFVYALDIDSGDVVWRNDSLGYLYGQHPHNTRAIGGLAPQGYLLIDGDELIVPCSTAYPARLNLQTGELIEFELPKPGRFPGGWFAAIDQKSARAIRRGKLAFDDVVNRQQHEDKLMKGDGISGISRTVHLGARSLHFDDGFDGVSGDVHAIAAADDRLFVTTRQGMIYCFASDDDPGTSQPIRAKHWDNPVKPLTASAQAIEFARKLLAESAAPHGYAFVIGLQDGSLVKALLHESNYHVVAIDNDDERVNRLRQELDNAGLYGTRAAVLQCDPSQVILSPYIATLVTTETPKQLAGSWKGRLQTLRPFGGIAALRITAGDDVAGIDDVAGAENVRSVNPGQLERSELDGQLLLRRVGALPGATDYAGDWIASPDELVRFPLGVLWFDDTLAHFKRSPQPQFKGGVMISRPKDWQAPRGGDNGDHSVDYPLLRPVLSDIYTGRVLDESEQTALRVSLGKTDRSKREPSQYRPPRQTDSWSPGQPVVGLRTNPLTGESEPRAFPKTYGCDGGVDYGSFFTLRSGTAAFYDKTLESGTVFLSGPRSGCTNSIIPAGGLLNVPYFYEGCTCSYPLPSAMSLFAMPESHEQWSSWGDDEIKPKSVQRIGLNFGAPGDRMTRAGTLWLDYPSVGGPSPQINVDVMPKNSTRRYRHSLGISGGEGWPWVTASAVEGLERLTLHDLKPGRYSVRLFFAEPDSLQVGDRVQNISLQNRIVLRDFDLLAETGDPMRGVVRQVDDVDVDDTLVVTLSALSGQTIISGIEIIQQR